ncbi:MAG: hypothetical protein WC003_11445 [Terrimicrobiaceae bacterium]
MNTPGVHFKQGKLRIFTEDEAMTVEAWPSLKAVQKVGIAPWEEFEPRFRILIPPETIARSEAEETLPNDETFSRQRQKAFAAFRARIPVPVAVLVEKYQSRQLKLLRLMLKSPASIELAGINPALCFALANYKRFRERFCTLEGAAIVAKRRQREIADWVGFPSTEAVVKILAKIPPESASLESLKSLRILIRNPEVMKLLSHLPRINAGVLGILAERRLLDMTKPTLLADIADRPEEDFHPHARETLLHIAEMLALVAPNSPLPIFSSLSKLQSFHDETTAEFLRVTSQKDGPLPNPPIAGTDNILPILTCNDLREEGRLQKNCVGGYVERIQKGGIFVYRVSKPKRATLSIVKTPEGDWIIGELKCCANANASDATYQAVQNWLDQHAFSW